MPPACKMGLPLSACSPVGTGCTLGVVVVRVVDRVVDVVVGDEDCVVDTATEVVLAVVSAPGSADRIVSGEAIAAPMTPSAATMMTASAICAPERRGCGGAVGGYGAGTWPGMYGGAPYPGGRVACAGGPGYGG
jgi:hypothetical protein